MSPEEYVPLAMLKVPESVAIEWYDDDVAGLVAYRNRRTGATINPFGEIPERGGTMRFTREELDVVEAMCNEYSQNVMDRKLGRDVRLLAALCRRAMRVMDAD